jgi:electron transport complex protein RnfB
MTELYERLAKVFDDMPNGFPATESGVERRILQKIFSPEDAEMALNLKGKPETAERVAKRLGKPVEEMEKILDDMALKGQILCMRKKGKQLYMLVPFVIGLYELQLDHLDEELALLFKEYRPHMTAVLGNVEPAVSRVVPVNRSIDAQHQVLRFEDMERIIHDAGSYSVRDCICRKQKSLEGTPCTHTSKVCLSFSEEENAYDFPSHDGQVIDKAQALDILQKTSEEGLVYCTYNVHEGHTWICSCCICCCELLQSLKEKKAPYVLAGSNFMAVIDPETCSACGACAEERCMMEAIKEEGETYRVLAERCIGCGVCAVTCPTESITLQRRPEGECTVPPRNTKAWSLERSKNRASS